MTKNKVLVVDDDRMNGCFAPRGTFRQSLEGHLRRTISGLSPEVAKVLRRYEWRGNVRELRNVIERAMILEDGDVITTECLPANLTEKSVAANSPDSSEMEIKNGVLRLPLQNLSLKNL